MSEVTDADAIKALSTFRKAEEWKMQYAGKPTLEHAQRMVESASQIATEVLARWAIQKLNKQEEDNKLDELIDGLWLESIGFAYHDACAEWYNEICGVSITLQINPKTVTRAWQCRIGYSGDEATLDWLMITRRHLVNLINGIKGEIT